MNKIAHDIDVSELVGKTITGVDEFFYDHWKPNKENDQSPNSKNAVRLKFSDGSSVRIFADYDDSGIHTEKYD